MTIRSVNQACQSPFARAQGQCDFAGQAVPLIEKCLSEPVEVKKLLFASIMIHDYISIHDYIGLDYHIRRR
jgi:hypothetical protein